MFFHSVLFFSMWICFLYRGQSITRVWYSPHSPMGFIFFSATLCLISSMMFLSIILPSHSLFAPRAVSTSMIRHLKPC